jgi:hypothetical protein
MTRFGSLILCATLGTTLLACGSSTSATASLDAATKNPVDFVPTNEDLSGSGWTIDEDHNKSPGEPAMVGHTYQDVTDLIDGGVGDFYFGSYQPTAFLWQNYKNLTLSSAPAPDGAGVKLYILQLPSADEASGLYTSILQFSDHKSSAGTPWQDPTTPRVGTESRIQDTGSGWWINFRQGAYYVEILVKPSTGPEPDYLPGNDQTKQEAFRFAQKIVSKM